MKTKNIINEFGDDEWATPEKENNMENIKVGIDAFNDLAKSHDAHVKEVERLQKEPEGLLKEIRDVLLRMERRLNTIESMIYVDDVAKKQILKGNE
jgi:hypothetical protein